MTNQINHRNKYGHGALARAQRKGEKLAESAIEGAEIVRFLVDFAERTEEVFGEHADPKLLNGILDGILRAASGVCELTQRQVLVSGEMFRWHDCQPLQAAKSAARGALETVIEYEKTLGGHR